MCIVELKYTQVTKNVMHNARWDYNSVPGQSFLNFQNKYIYEILYETP